MGVSCNNLPPVEQNVGTKSQPEIIGCFFLRKNDKIYYTQNLVAKILIPTSNEPSGRARMASWRMPRGSNTALQRCKLDTLLLAAEYLIGGDAYVYSSDLSDKGFLFRTHIGL